MDHLHTAGLGMDSDCISGLFINVLGGFSKSNIHVVLDSLGSRGRKINLTTSPTWNVLIAICCLTT